MASIITPTTPTTLIEYNDIKRQFKSYFENISLQSGQSSLGINPLTNQIMNTSMLSSGNVKRYDFTMITQDPSNFYAFKSEIYRIILALNDMLHDFDFYDTNTRVTNDALASVSYNEARVLFNLYTYIRDLKASLAFQLSGDPIINQIKFPNDQNDQQLFITNTPSIGEITNARSLSKKWVENISKGISLSSIEDSTKLFFERVFPDQLQSNNIIYLNYANILNAFTTIDTNQPQNINKAIYDYGESVGLGKSSGRNTLDLDGDEIYEYSIQHKMYLALLILNFFFPTSQ